MPGEKRTQYHRNRARADGSVVEDSVSCDDYVTLLPPNTCPGPAPTTTTTTTAAATTAAAPPSSAP